MRYLIPTVLASAAVAGTSVVSAAPIASFVVSPSQPTAAAIAADSALANTTTFELRSTSPVDWTNATITFNLTKGSFYNAAANGNTPPNPALFAFLPQLQFDTYLSAPNETTPGFAGNTTFTSTTIDAAWFDSVTTAPSTYTIGRFTVSNDAVGTVSGLLYDSQSNAVGTPYAFSVPTPEPTSLALLGLTAVGALRRRRA